MSNKAWVMACAGSRYPNYNVIISYDVFSPRKKQILLQSPKIMISSGELQLLLLLFYPGPTAKSCNLLHLSSSAAPFTRTMPVPPLAVGVFAQHQSGNQSDKYKWTQRNKGKTSKQIK